MSEICLNDERRIGDYETPYIVAEVNSSHNGSLDTAIEMIDKIKMIGADCVKFQSWSADSLYAKDYYEENPIAKRIISKFALSEEQLDEVFEYCAQVGISVTSTPYSKQEVDFLVKHKVPYIKIASMDINNYMFLKYIGETGLPIVLATGMADMEEIKRAVEIIESTGNRKLCLLHCVSVYPAPPEIIQLNNILGLREKFPEYPIGFSDHSLGVEMAAAATAFGACMIEKHFTLDKKKMGMDNNMATEPDEFKKMIEISHNVCQGLGTKERVVTEDEKQQRVKMRRSIVLTRDMKAGEVIKEEDLDAKRPGTGISVENTSEIVGKRVVRNKVRDEFIYQGDYQ